MSSYLDQSFRFLRPFGRFGRFRSLAGCSSWKCLDTSVAQRAPTEWNLRSVVSAPACFFSSGYFFVPNAVVFFHQTDPLLRRRISPTSFALFFTSRGWHPWPSDQIVFCPPCYPSTGLFLWAAIVFLASHALRLTQFAAWKPFVVPSPHKFFFSDIGPPFLPSLEKYPFYRSAAAVHPRCPAQPVPLVKKFDRNPPPFYFAKSICSTIPLPWFFRPLKTDIFSCSVFFQRFLSVVFFFLLSLVVSFFFVLLPSSLLDWVLWVRFFLQHPKCPFLTSASKTIDHPTACLFRVCPRFFSTIGCVLFALRPNRPLLVPLPPFPPSSPFFPSPSALPVQRGFLSTFFRCLAPPHTPPKPTPPPRFSQI